MDYVLHAGGENLVALDGVFNEACVNNGVKIGPIRRMRIMRKFIELAKEKRLLEKMEESATEG